MTGMSARASHAPSGLLGVLKSWLQARASEIWPSPEVLPIEAEAPNADFHAKVRVLVVDDHPVNLMVISALLESRGVVPLLAADGAEAVALASELHLDLILMDLQMPVLDGLTATLAIRRFEANNSRAAVPVVAYSSSSPSAAVLAAHGLNGSLDKPCRVQELEDCLAQWCPTYPLASTGRGGAHDKGGWQSPSRSSGTSSATLG